MYSIPPRMDNVINTKNKLKTLLDSIGLDTNTTFRLYASLIEKVPDSGAISHEEVDEAVEQVININGEKI